MSSITPNMLLTIPTVGNAAVPDGGPGYATEINAAITLIDAHDHSSGKGLPVTQNGINITGALTFQTNPATGLTYIAMTNQTAALATTRALYNVNGELYWTDGSGNQVKITSAGAVNTGGSGNLSGMDGLAAVTYSAVTKVFTLTQTAAFPAKVAMGDLLLFETVAAAAQTVTIKAPAGLANTFTLTLPGALPATTALPQFSATGVLSFLAAPGATSILQSTAAGALSYVTTLPSGLTLPSGTIVTAPAFTGTATGSLTSLALTTPVLTSPTLSGVVIASMFSEYMSGCVPVYSASNQFGVGSGKCIASDGQTLIAFSSLSLKDLSVLWVAGPSAGALDAGVVANTTYHIYVISKGDGSAADLIASTSATFAGVDKTRIATYTYGRRVFSVKRLAGALQFFTAYESAGGGLRMMLAVPVQDFASSAVGTSAVTWTTSCPLGFQFLAHTTFASSGALGGPDYALVTSPDQSDSTPSASLFDLIMGGNASSSPDSIQADRITSTTATLRYRCSASGAQTMYGQTNGWTDFRRS